MIEFKTKTDGVCSLKIAGTLEQLGNDIITLFSAMHQSVQKQGGKQAADALLLTVCESGAKVYRKMQRENLSESQATAEPPKVGKLSQLVDIELLKPDITESGNETVIEGLGLNDELVEIKLTNATVPQNVYSVTLRIEEG